MTIWAWWGLSPRYVIISSVKVSELGEFGLIDYLHKIVDGSRTKSAPAWRDLIIGIGDDAAAWYGDGAVQLATIDASIEGVHFNLDITPWGDLGWKSLAVSLSDIAAMGGLPRYAMVSLALPGNTEVEDVLALYREMTAAAKRFGVAIVGGNTSSSSSVIIDTVVIGSALNKERILTRSAAQVGDQIAVTNTLGGAAAGYYMLSKRLKPGGAAMTVLRKAFRRPEPRVGEGQLLVAHGVKAAIDISDGLISDLGHICKQSGVGAVVNVDHVPVHPAVKTAFPDKMLELALSGGEDYELLFTAKTPAIESLKRLNEFQFTVIGEIVADKRTAVKLVDGKGKPFRLKKTGWEHFSSK